MFRNILKPQMGTRGRTTLRKGQVTLQVTAELGAPSGASRLVLPTHFLGLIGRMTLGFVDRKWHLLESLGGAGQARGAHVGSTRLRGLRKPRNPALSPWVPANCGALWEI